MWPVRFGRRRQNSEVIAGDHESQRHQLLEQSERYPYWFHSIDLGEGVVTRGVKTPEHLASELNALRLPDLNGQTVLDIGTWDGFYAFEAERRGAANVVALDRFVWAWDQAAEQAAHPPDGAARPRNGAGRRAAQDESPAWWDPVGLPGKHNFDLVHRTRGSRVKPVVADFVSDDLSFLGTFDVVLFLGVLYHMEDLLGSLRRLAELTSGMAIVETEARVFPGPAATPLCEYLAGHYVDDPTNWWAPNEAALRLMFLEAGFATVEVFGDPPAPPGPSATEPVHYRTILHAHKRSPE
jgi:tRNA (mo5U34)-methyltransferase